VEFLAVSIVVPTLAASHLIARADHRNALREHQNWARCFFKASLKKPVKISTLH
jgi:hypothetical protein